MPFDIDTPKMVFEKTTRAIDWVAEEIIRQRNWRSILTLLDVILFLAFNPFQWPFPNLLSLFSQIEQISWFKPTFWFLITAIFILAVVAAAARTNRKSLERVELKLSAIKGLLPFGYEDAEIFNHLERNQSLQECLQAISDGHWRFGVLTGESGAGKTSFLQAGLWPEIEKRKFSCIYVKFSNLDPFESVIRACRKHLPEFGPQTSSTDDHADFLSLLRAAAERDSTPILFLFDQFEQFFVHHKRKSDRTPFVHALVRWFTEMQSLPIKILICIRSDFSDRMNELQKEMKYLLGPTQSFRLEKFEPEQAAEVFCVLAERENLEYDRKFISEMTRQELVDIEDGLISPVDIQVLARMIQRQAVREGRAFNRSTFQRLGGVEGLLDRYLTSTVETRETQARRQAAIKVLLALVDLERNTREGALALGLLRRKLGGELSDAELEDTVAWLRRSDVRLVSPSSESDGEKFELAHERMIPALRRLAGKQLSDADRANQLLDRRTNEWLGNGRHSRYLFSWFELRLINRQRRFITWGKERQAKGDLLAVSKRRFRLRFASAGMVLLLAVAGWIGWHSNVWQTYLIRMELSDYSNSMNDKDTLTSIARAFAYAGASRPALQAVERISKDSDKLSALYGLALYSTESGEKESAVRLLSEAVEMAQRIGEIDHRTSALGIIATSFANLGVKSEDRELLLEAVKTAEQIGEGESKAVALRQIAESFANLGERVKDRALLSEAVEMAQRIGEIDHRTSALGIIATSFANLGVKSEDRELLLEAVKTAEQIGEGESKAVVLRQIAESFANLGERVKDRALLSEAVEIAQRISAIDYRISALKSITACFANLGEKMKDRELLLEGVKTIDRITSKDSKIYALRLTSESFAGLGDEKMADALLSEAIGAAGELSDDYRKTDVLKEFADYFAKLGNKERASALLVDAINQAERLNGDPRQTSTLIAIAASLINLGEKERASLLLSNAIKPAIRLNDDSAKFSALWEITAYFAALGDKERAIAILSEVINKVGQSDFAATFFMEYLVASITKLGDKERATTLLLEAVEVAERITNNYGRAGAFTAIAESFIKLGDKERAIALLSEQIKKAEQISNDSNQTRYLGEVMKSFANLGEKMKDRGLLLEAVKTAEQIGRGDDKVLALIAIVEAFIRFGDKEKASLLLSDAIKTAEQNDPGDSMAAAMGSIAKSAAKLGEYTNDRTLYDKTFNFIERLGDDRDKDGLLDSILTSRLAVVDVGRLRLLASRYGSVGGRARALARILIACSRPE
jgi:tetratricopeptide (TPR) repeat protein